MVELTKSDLILKKKKTRETKRILYTGMLSKWGGVTLLIKAFAKMKDPSLELWICGYGNSSIIDKALRKDSRITFFGMVNETKLISIYQRASVFVNPRPNYVSGNDMNFPSKILEYMSYGKPIISTWTPGLSEEYRDFLEVPEQDTPLSLARTIEEVLGWCSKEILEREKKLNNF